MSRFWTWASWDLDWQTVGWIGWLAFFPIWETLTGFGPNEQLTHHLRPLLLTAPIIWFLMLGVWLWLGVHMFAPSLEAWLLEVAS